MNPSSENPTKDPVTPDAVEIPENEPLTVETETTDVAPGTEVIEVETLPLEETTYYVILVSPNKPPRTFECSGQKSLIQTVRRECAADDNHYLYVFRGGEKALLGKSLSDIRIKFPNAEEKITVRINRKFKTLADGWIGDVS